MLLTTGSVAALYTTCFISQKMEGSILGRCLALCGKYSFHIMALQFAGFKVGTLILSLFGVERSLAALSAPAGDSFLLFLYYLLMGLMLPVVFVSLFVRLKRVITEKKEL